MEAEKSQGLESAGWRPRRADAVILVQKPGGLRSIKSDVSVWRWGKTSVPAQSSHAGGVPFCSGFLFYSGVQLIRWGPKTLGRAVCFTPSINSNVNLTQKYPNRHTRNNVWSSVWETHCPVKSTHKINHYNQSLTLFLKFHSLALPLLSHL